MAGNDYDAFDDFLNGDGAGAEGGGILESPGLRDYEGIETTIGVEGARVVLNCRRCNRKKQVVVEWPELIILAENGPGKSPLLPTGWNFSEKNRTAYVPMRCNSCGNDTGIAIHMAPDEARGHVNAALNAGLVNRQQVAQIQQQVNGARARGGG